ncbi:MAG: hypothetical protein UZ05_CHB002001325 [Chlorobi bacterium OLB5]|nr:MAG: hypothetical protein UZ05_CHB002001325 [Chlorobi bacterium OLB5]
MKTLIISPDEARYLALINQGLDNYRQHKTKKDLLNIITKLGYVQIDTISIIERAHKHILWTRFPGYRNDMLDELIDKDKKVFEFWDHAAAYLPMKFYRFSLPRKKMYAEKYKTWEKKNKKLLKYILERISAEGPLQSRDFDDPKKRGLWWDWKPAKEGLEFLFHTGRLIARARKNFQKVYDLPERFLTAAVNTEMPSYEELAEHLIMKSITSGGITAENEFTYLRYHNRNITKKVLIDLTENSKIIPVKISNDEKTIYYSTTKILNKLNNAFKFSNDVYILSPFDNLVIQRGRLKKIFGYDYVIECYLPAHKRKFGYFCLPVLYGDKIAGKIDTRADRKTGELTVINEFWETGVKTNKDFRNIYLNKLNELALFAGCYIVKYNSK